MLSFTASSSNQAQATLRLVQLTDLHLLTDAKAKYRDIYPQVNFLQTLALAQQLKPDYLVLTGDLAEDEQETTYAWLHEQLNLSGLKWLWLAGNHDNAQFMRQFAPTNFYIEELHWLLVGLNSQLFGATQGYLTAEQLELVERALAQPKPVYFALHHHPITVGSTWKDELGLTNATQFNQLLQATRPKTAIISFGHIHQEFYAQQGHLTYLGCPATSVEFTARSNTFSLTPQALPRLRLLRLSPEGKFSTRVLPQVTNYSQR